MTEDDLRNKWFPTSLYEARVRRMEYDRWDQYPNCRHHGKTQKDDNLQRFHCAEKKKELTTCNGCRTCTNCNGRPQLYQSRTSYVRNRAYHTEEFTCLNCGAYYIRVYFQVKQQGKPEKQAGFCHVEGCTRRTYEGHQHQEEGVTWIICEAHHRQVKTWNTNTGKGQEQKPLLVQDCRLVSNPNYRKKQEKRRK